MIKQVIVLAAMATVCWAVAVFAAPLCARLAGNCAIQPTGDEYTRQIFSGNCRWVYRGDSLVRDCK